MFREEEPLYMSGGVVAGVAGVVATIVAISPLSEGKKSALMTGVAVGTPLVAAYYGRNYVAPLGPNREQAGEGHPHEALIEEFTPDAGGGPEAMPGPDPWE